MTPRLTAGAMLLASVVSAPASGQVAAPAPPSSGEPAPAEPAAQVEAKQERASENAVTQAEDAFGFSIGRETLGLYTSSNVRGFSPLSAGNVRVEGLYFDQFFGLTARVRRSTSIKVGLSAQGYPFPSPTGIYDYRFRKPGDEASLSMLAGIDSYGAATAEFDAVVPIVDGGLSAGFGAYVAHNSFYNGTDSISHNQGISLRWRPVPEVELIPFWTRSQVHDDEQGPIYVPAGAYLPPRVERRRYDGPGWADYAGVATTQGILGSAALGQDWMVRAGVFRSLYDDTSVFTHLLTGLEPDGSADRLIIADPRSLFVSVSGELRVTRSLAEGPRLHVIHLSGRARDRRQRYDGADVRSFGPTRIGQAFDVPRPAFVFGEQADDRVRQWTAGAAYEGRWKNVGELSFGISRTDYSKRVDLPGIRPATTRSRPWLYNVAAAGHVSATLALYGGYARGLEESGVAPSNAVNRNAPLPAILTTQWDGGFRYALTPKLKLIAGVFDLRKPYYNLDQGNRFTLLGDVRNQGVELSLAGALTPRLDIVSGGVLLRPRVTGEGVALGRVGPRPVGLPVRSIDLNADWRPPWIEGLSLDIGISHTGSIPATRDNRVALPDRTLVDLGGRYSFALGGRKASLRVQASNVTDVEGFQLRGAGAYDIIAGRMASAYLTLDF